MDALKKELKPMRGCFIFIGVILLIGAFGGIFSALEPRLGGWAVLPALTVVASLILFWVSLAKGARWAKMIAGILLVLIGVGITVFIIYDFITSLIKGESLLRTDAISPGNYGTSAFIIFMFGLGAVGIGLLLLGWKKDEF